MQAPGTPPLSVVIPARDAERTIGECLAAVTRSAGPHVEIIVVDDGSRDRTAEIARSTGATVLTLTELSGPAVARNAGVRRASADVVLFIDADVIVAPDGVPRIVAAFREDPGLSATFGSYDDAPSGGSLVSDARNLLHHFVHQTSLEQSASFWAGFGAIRTAAFRSIGGFDERYRRPSIEDIELGGRLAAAGHRIRLDKQLTARHAKRWTLAGLVVTDIRDRAYPWTRLVLQQGTIPVDLNLQHAHRASAALVWLAAVCGLVLIGGWAGTATAAVAIAGAAAVAGFVHLNRQFYAFLASRRGWAFTTAAVGLHALYYAYASATFAWAWWGHLMDDARRRWSRSHRRDPASGASL
jgi:hypothetical protein